MFSLFRNAPTKPAETTSSGEARVLPAVNPEVDIVDTGRELILYADLPGVASSGLDLSIEGDRLSLKGTPSVAQPAGLRLVHQEAAARRFEVTFSLSDTIDRERIHARINEGVAVITLPRRDAVAPRRIQVQVA